MNKYVYVLTIKYYNGDDHSSICGVFTSPENAQKFQPGLKWHNWRDIEFSAVSPSGDELYITREELDP